MWLDIGHLTFEQSYHVLESWLSHHLQSRALIFSTQVWGWWDHAHKGCINTKTHQNCNFSLNGVYRVMHFVHKLTPA